MQAEEKNRTENLVVEKRWAAGRKKAAGLCLFAGELLDTVSRDLGVTHIGRKLRLQTLNTL